MTQHLSFNLRISSEKSIDSVLLDDLFAIIGWRKRGKKKWTEVLSKSSYVYSVWNQNKLIGFGRIMEDGVMCMFYDIAVHPAYQGKGIGKKLMETMIKKVKDKKYASIGLFAWEENPNNIPFYEKFGFVKQTTGMELLKYMKRE